MSRAPKTDEEAAVTPDDDVAVSNWEFVDTPPSTEDLTRLLSTLPDCYGVAYVDYAEYVQALPQKKKMQRPIQNRPGSFAMQEVQTWSLYMSVAGRIKMLADAAVRNGWSVEFEPEPFTPTQIPGMLAFEDRIVYREYCTVKMLPAEPGQEPVLLGRRPGTAWVPATGGKQAAGSNPFEKVETSARGRAIAAWGIGVLPGSGVASLEEMHAARDNQRLLDRQAQAGRDRAAVQESADPGTDRDALVESVLTLSERLRQERGLDEEQALARTTEYLQQRLGIADPRTPDGAAVDWSKVKTGQLILYRNTLQQTLQQIVDARSDI